MRSSCWAKSPFTMARPSSALTPTKLVGLLVDALCVRVTVENAAGHSGSDLRLRVHPPLLVEVWYPPRVPAQGARLLAIVVEGVYELAVLTMIWEALILEIREFDPCETDHVLHAHEVLEGW